MKKFLLMISVWIAGVSFALAANGRNVSMPFSEGYSFSINQDAPVYPNPARDHIYVSPSRADFPDDGSLTIEIRNILGNKMPVRLERTAQRTFRVNLASYPSGYYMLVLQCERCGTDQDTQKEIHKFLKQ